ncbi:hypothetical protein ACHHYP_09832 [Achlya hypogyna]|uniref:PX domain-containing protein n=1 Tax=Achlya hypogyna TaxID=1202772 RepID=A0A1V9YMA2_ACHHY|nr:hypothetical protein ACHHYP_09832 [Achlya hypogyna]
MTRYIELVAPSLLCGRTYTLHVHDTAGSWSIDRAFHDFTVLRATLLRCASAPLAATLRRQPFPPTLLHRFQRAKLSAFLAAADAACTDEPAACAVLEDFLGVAFVAPTSRVRTPAHVQSRLLSLSQLYDDDDEEIADVAFELGLWGLGAADVCLLLDVLLRTLAKARVGAPGAYVLENSSFALDPQAFVREVMLLSATPAVRVLLEEHVPRSLEVLAQRVWRQHKEQGAT